MSPALLQGAAALHLEADVLAALRARLPAVALAAVEAITREVPAYADAFAGPMGETISVAVRTALGALLDVLEPARPAAGGDPLHPALTGAYALGQGEARTGRSLDALLAAYRIGARVSWRELSGTAVTAHLSADRVATLAEVVFAYIDQLSGSSAAGHADELASTGRAQERRLERLAAELLEGRDPERLAARAARAGWEPPAGLVAVVLPAARARDTVALLDARALLVAEPPGAEPDRAALLVPVADEAGRAPLLAVLRGRPAVVGPVRPWQEVRSSYLRALRAGGLPSRPAQPLDTEEHLPALLLTSDSEALADLRRRALAPLGGLKDDTAARLAETLRAWLLHQGRREDVAAALHVHPQTVRYRMGQVRTLYGDALEDPATVLALVLALGAD